MAQDGPKKKALVIAVSDYKNLEKLDFCKTDGDAVHGVLEQLGYQISEKLVGNVSYDKMRLAMIRFFRDMDIRTDDTVLFYYTGHGDISSGGGKFFCTSNYDKQMPEENGISFSLLRELLDVCNSLKKIVMVDCCYSGAVVPGHEGMGPEDDSDAKAAKLQQHIYNQYENSSGQIVLASSLGTHKSFPHPSEPYSIFSYFLIEGLKGKAIDSKGKITADTLYSYIFGEISKLGLLQIQKPVKAGAVVGDLLLADYPPPEDKRSMLLRLLRDGKIKEFNKIREADIRDLVIDPKKIKKENIIEKILDFSEVTLTKKDLGGAVLKFTEFMGANLDGANLKNTNLVGAEFAHSSMVGADFSGAIFHEKIFHPSPGSTLQMESR